MSARPEVNRVYVRQGTPKQLAPEELTLEDSRASLRSNHYAITAADPHTRRPYGAFAVFQPSDAPERHDNYCACLCVPPPAYGWGAPFDHVERYRIAALFVDVRHRKVAEEIEAVIAQRIVWPSSARVQPLRVAEDGSTLRLYQLPPRADGYSGPRSLAYTLPGDAAYGEPHTVRVLCVGEFFTVSGPLAERPEVGYQWRPGLDAAHHDALPLIPDIAAASVLVNACEGVLRRHGKPI
jgi:hypothetical protein